MQSFHFISYVCIIYTVANKHDGVKDEIKIKKLDCENTEML